MFKGNKEKLDIENLNEVVFKSKKILKVVYVIAILAVIAMVIFLTKELKIFSILGKVLQVITPFFIGLLIAWLLDPIVTWLSKRKVKRIIGSIFVFFLFLVVVYLTVRVMIPMLYNQINDFVSTLPNIFLSINNFIHNFFNGLGGTGVDYTSIEDQVYSSIESLSADLTTKLPSTIINLLTSIVSGIGTFMLGLIVGFYLLIDFDGISTMLDLVPKRFHDNVAILAKKLNATLKDFVQGTLIISIVVFIVSSIGYAIIGLPSPMLFGLISGITNIIPYVGPWLGGGIASLIGFTVSPIVGVLTAIVAFAMQQLDGMVLQPLIMGKTMKLHPVTIMIGLLIFGYFFGIVGMIFATPIIAGLKVIISYFDEKYGIVKKITRDE